MVITAEYLQVVRKGRGLTRSQVSARIQALLPALLTSESTVWRIEKGKQEPSAPLLMAFVQAVQGSIEDVKYLLLNTKATPNDARELAQQWLRLSPEQRALLEAQADASTDEDLLAVITLFEQMRTDVTLRRQFMAYGRGLLDAQRNGTPVPEPPPSLLPRQRPPGDSDE